MMRKHMIVVAVSVSIRAGLATMNAASGCGQNSGAAEQATHKAEAVSNSPTPSETPSPSPSPSPIQVPVAGVWATGVDTGSDRGVILSSADGGTSWSATCALESQYNERFGFNSSITFGDSAHGWMAGGGYILSTDDAGASWRYVRNKNDMSTDSGVDVDFGGLGGLGTCLAIAAGSTAIGADNAWLTAEIQFSNGDVAPAILATKDAGSSWTVQTLPMETVWGVTFADTERGWAVGGDPVSTDESRLQIAATVDGGSHWRIQYSGPRGTFADVAFADSTSGWAVSDNGGIVTTSDGGSHWRSQYELKEASFRGVATPDAQHIWVVGVDYALGKDLILTSSDGGATWSEQDPGVDDANLLDVVFSDAMTGWAVGGAGILGTTDGGQTWQQQPSSGSYDVSEVLITRTDGDSFEKTVDESGALPVGASTGMIRSSHVAIARDIYSQ